jgi:hydroxyacylglutathione hydrolase
LFFKRFYDEGLAQASYLIGCETTGEAIVVDANRDAATYMSAAKAEGFRITRVTETHIHADFVSGTRELAHGTGATVHLSGEGGAEWQYAFARSDGAALLHDGDVINVGRIRLDVLHTPGHTPEHLAFLVTDHAATDRPLGLLSGDFVFVGDVGRPDLLEKAANIAGTMQASARALFHSLDRFRALPEFVQLWPGHGAGSACGKSLGAMPQSTVGYERIANWGVASLDEEAFVQQVLEGQPDPPPYFAEMKRVNRAGPRVLGAMLVPALRNPANTVASVAAGELVVDVRPADLFAAAHIPGSLNLPLGGSFLKWAGWVLPYDRDILLIAASETGAALAARELTLIGFDRVVGWFGDNAFPAWERSSHALGRVEQTGTGQLAQLLGRGGMTLLDVRSDAEWEEGHIAGALGIPLGELSRRLAEIPRAGPVVVHCQGGTRSAIAASILLANGVRDVTNLRGGFDEWIREGRTAVRD